MAVPLVLIISLLSGEARFILSSDWVRRLSLPCPRGEGGGGPFVQLIAASTVTVLPLFTAMEFFFRVMARLPFAPRWPFHAFLCTRSDSN